MLFGCVGNWNPNHTPKKNYPYFIVKEPIRVKNIEVPKGTKLTYEDSFFKKGEQKKALDEELITMIEFPESTPLYWGGLPIVSIVKFDNTSMKGYTLTANFTKTPNKEAEEFFNIWKSHQCTLALNISNTDDWSFNRNNIEDIENFGSAYQRYFKEDRKQQKVLDEIYQKLIQIPVKTQ